MVKDMRDNLYKARKMEKESYIGKIMHGMRVNFKMGIYMEMESMCGLMVKCIQVNGKII